MERTVGFWKRLGANLLDSLIIILPLSLLGMLLFGMDFDHPAFNLLGFLYTLILPVLWHGYLVGKRLIGIRIVKIDGSDVGLGTMLMRQVVAGVAYMATLGIGIIVSAFMVGLRDDNRSIHDFIASTYVTEAKPGEL
ncbi:RDD family protein [Halobacillus seohaensis]|uniref:RDD family protein n=1 Tax=Halobacillus seohaensis TaxID=447421 RepID=A0ABW2EPT9_9BACI